MNDQGVNPTATRSDFVRLAGYSFLILFFELAFIRYISAYVRVFGYYLNFVLIATFLGMGVGLLRSGLATRLKWMAPVVGVVLFAVVKYLSNVVVRTPDDPDEFIWGVFFEISPTVARVGILPTVTILFTLCVVFFVPLGALLGDAFRRFKPLHAYSIDIGGSLLGILTFAVLSWLRSPPVVWFAIGCIVWTLLSFRTPRFAGIMTLASVAMVALVFGTALREGEHWSPYYRINDDDRGNRHSINVNGSFHQWVINFDPDSLNDPTVGAHYADIRRFRDHYLAPFEFFDVPDTVLVVGSGTGNDLALLLQLGVKYIDAVEIDPVILDLGKQLHFQQPYADSRVHAHVTDARRFLRRTKQRYDLIVFGTLDSQTLLSGMGSLRLDNYVYTTEAFRAAKARLKEGGSLVAYHMSAEGYIAAKIAGIIAEGFEQVPALVVRRDYVLFNITLVAGAAAEKAIEAWGYPDLTAFSYVTLPEDDWPYLYLSEPTIPKHYQRALAAVLLVALIAVSVGGGRQVVKGFNWTMFFMGMGFLLLETKSVSEMSLLFGATWQVNLLVFSSILAMILIANLCVLKWRPQRMDVLFGGLFVSLALAFAIPARSLLWLGTIGEWMVGGLIVALPIFFAAIIFATLFQNQANPTGALAANLLGAVIGGVAEYMSMLIGVKGLYLVAALAYAAAFSATRKGATESVAETNNEYRITTSSNKRFIIGW